jgi:hypothetical protein
VYSWVPYVRLLFPAINLIGLLIVAIGAFVTARAVIMTEEAAVKVAGQAPTGSAYAGPNGPTMPTQNPI